MRVNEIFYSLQGEGFHTGTPAVFVRFSGCNLMCAFCDTEHDTYEDLSEEEIVDRVACYPAQMVVITGGEPALQLTESLVDKLHQENLFVAVETNGTMPLPQNIDWITLSPKQLFVGEKGRVVLPYADEVKVIFDGKHSPYEMLGSIDTDNLFLQPCDTGNKQQNAEIIAQCVDFVKQNPEWRLSLQTHKLIGIQ
ncbi:MAG: radical SAM protein [Prevotella sp.]|nr:radical SAM protein [Prevotella sp.]